MARYEDEFGGISGGFGRPAGADPNFRDGYQGMRMRGGEGLAPYGAYRYRHRGDLGGWGGWSGIYPDSEPRRLGRYDGEHRRGGVRPFGDPGFLHEYNANSPAYRGRQPRWRGEEYRGASREQPRRDWEMDRRYRPGYSDRGMGDAGYSEPWARFPMRGGR